jgi:hypothetical protein
MGLLLGIAVVVAGGRVTVRYLQFNRVTIDDGFFFLAVLTLIAGTILLYLDLPYVYLVEDIEAGIRAPPAGTSCYANIPKTLLYHYSDELRLIDS